MLSGSELLSKISSLEAEQLSETAQARACGYTTLTKDGKTRVDVNKFRRAVMEAHGHSFAPGSIRNRAPRGYVVVGKNGSAVVGKNALLKVQALAGQHLKVDAVDGQLVLTPISASEAEASAPPTLQQAVPQPALV